MKPVSPRTGMKEVTFAANQEEYHPVIVAEYPEIQGEGTRGLLWRFSFSFWERLSILFGKDVYIMQLNFHTPMTPMSFSVGPKRGWTVPQDPQP